jgi:hypothetical protein
MRGRGGLVARTFALAMLVMALAVPSAAAPMLVLDLGGQGPGATLSPGESLVVSVLADGIPPGGDGNGMFGFGFRLAFDPAGLSAGDPAIDALWSGLSATSVMTGEVGATANRLGEAAGPSGDGILLARFDVAALAPGSFVLSLAPFTGPGDNVLFDGTVLDGDAAFFGMASVVVRSEPAASVPEPGAAVLFALGAGAVALTTRLRAR